MIVINPFEELIDVDEFAEFNELLNKWEVVQDVRILFPREYELNNIDGEYWGSFNSNITHPYIDVDKGYSWDGASGPAMDTPSLRLASMVHDIICTNKGGLKPVADYFTRHYMYYEIANAQQCPTWRAFLHLSVLVPFNWIYDLIKNRGTNK